MALPSVGNGQDLPCLSSWTASPYALALACLVSKWTVNPWNKRTQSGEGKSGMNNIAKLLVQSAMAALTICGFLAITLPFVLDRQDIPDPQDIPCHVCRDRNQSFGL